MNHVVPSKSILSIVLFLLALITHGVVAQDKVEDENGDKNSIKPYAEVIGNDAQTMHGMIVTHNVKNDYFFEIPDSLFGRDIMSITRLSKTPAGAGYGGEETNRQVIRFEKGPDKNVFIKLINYINVSSDSSQIITQAVENSNVNPLVAVFDIKAYGNQESVVINVNDFFNDPNQAFQIPPLSKQYYKLTELKKDRSYISSVKSFPINTEVRSVKTYGIESPKLRAPGSTTPGPRKVDLLAGQDAGVVTFELNTSFILLSKEPRQKRFFDPRVGIFSNRYTVFDDEGQRTQRETFTVRWPLDPKNKEDMERQKSGEAIEPKKPIVFYIDPATPMKWRPYLKKGVEDWQPAFEQAGWKNAIMAKDWPEDDPNMSLEDARFSVIRYFASDIQNAYGPNVHDPRSGEILESHIGWYHNVMKLLKSWYTTQAAAVDERARRNEFDDELMGTLVRFVSAHEVGHTIGLRHNFGASHATPVEKLRDKEYTDTFGHTSSIMDYARFNYVAQPGDGVTNLLPRVGDYDKWAVEWNYKPIYDTDDPYEQKKILNKWYKEKAEKNPRLHFITEVSPYDPRAQSEDLGDNAVLASKYGIENLKKILPNAIEWTKEEAEPYNMAAEVYYNVVSQYRRYMGHVTKWVGGVYETPKTTDQEGLIYKAVSGNRQREAVAFLNAQLFQTPTWLIDSELLGMIRPDQGVAAINQIQKSTLNSLLNVNRLQRVIEASENSLSAYSIDELYIDLHSGIWSELANGASISTHRRNLQKIHLDNLISLLNSKEEKYRTRYFLVTTPVTINPMHTDVVSISRAMLKRLKGDMAKAVKKQNNKLSKYHLEDCIYRIDKALGTEK